MGAVAMPKTVVGISPTIISASHVGQSHYPKQNRPGEEFLRDGHQENI
jgi:hypothetical protein